MPIPSKTYGKGRSGVANVVINGEKVIVTFEDNGQSITCLISDAPDYIRPGRQAVTLNGNNTEIYGARPIGGTYRSLFAGFAAKEGEPPTIRSVQAKAGTSQNGKPYKIAAHLEFTALFDVVAGKWKGYRLVYNLPYSFHEYEQSDEESITMVSGAKLIEFLQICGMDFDTDTIPWSDNVLPYLDKLLSSRKRPLAISLNENGWVKDIGEIPEDDSDEVETKPTHDQAKESAKKIADQLTGELPVSDEDAAKYKKEAAKIKAARKAEEEEVEHQVMEENKATKPKSDAKAPTMLTIMFNNAKNGDVESLNMLTGLAAAGNAAAKELLAQLE